MKALKKFTSTLLIGAMLMSTACSSKESKPTLNPEETTPRSESNITASINLNNLERLSVTNSSITDDYRDYCISMFQQAISLENENSNVMISPASIMFALEMTAAGAEDLTLAQLSALISPNSEPQDIQAFAHSYMDHLNDNNGVELHVANSIWMRECMLADCISEDFLDFIDEYYYAEANMSDFDNATVEEINEWVNDNTDGMIPRVIDNINPNTVMFLINAIAFDGAWSDPYEDYQVHREDFTTSTGNTIDVEMMNSTENYYFETELATGFAKYYEGGDYYFLAILPTDESISANEFAMNFTSEDYEEFINSRTSEFDVLAKLPKFSYAYNNSMVPALQNMDVTVPFIDSEANFDSIAQIPGYYFYISDVLHSTYIEVNEEGTRAAAVTVVVMDANACAPYEETPIREVYLDRPFCYAIVDAATDTPIFIGTVNDI